MAITFTAGYTFAAAEKVTPTKLNTAQTGLVLSMATSRLLGRTTASAGTVEEITPGAGLDFSSLGLSVGWLDTNSSHRMRIACGSDLSADRTITITPGDSARTITLSGNPTLADWFDQSVKTTATPTFGATTLTGALTGTSASFSSTLAAGNTTITGTLSVSAPTASSSYGSLIGLGNAGSFPTLSSGQGTAYGNATNGLSLAGNGSAAAVTILTSAGSTISQFTSTGLAVTGTLGASGNVWSGNNAFAMNSGTTDGAYMDSGGGLIMSANGGVSLQIRRRTSDGNLAQFYRDTTNVGSISVTTTSTAYNTSSDARLKTDLGAFSYADVAAPIYALHSIMRKYAWDVWRVSDDPAKRERFAYGWFAQEAKTVAPWLVNYDAQSDRYSINPMALVPNIVACLGTHKTELDLLKARVAALEAA